MKGLVKHLERDFLKGQAEEAGSVLVVGDEEGCRPVDRQRVLEIVERAERRPQSRLLRTEEDLCVVAGEITEQLGELDFGMEDDEDHPNSDRLKLDYARLLANAVRDRIDPEPWARIQALIGALQGLEITFSQSRFTGTSDNTLTLPKDNKD